MKRLSENIVEFYDKLSSWENETVRDSGITLQQAHTLEVIGSNKEIRMKEITQRLGIATGTLTVMIDRLTKLDLVKRVVNTSDKRSYYIELTNKGQALYKEHSNHHDMLVTELAHDLSDTERETLNNLLEKILERF
ncbi:MAG: MarR family transcriptional regulator [Candidatus Cloacimonadales bacterium]